MNSNKRISWLWAFGMAFLLSFGSLGAFVSGFGFVQVDMQDLALKCLIFALLWAAIFRLCRNWLWLCTVSAIVLILLWLGNVLGLMVDSFEVLVHQISKIYDSGYRWGVVQWSETLPQVPMDMALDAIGCIICLVAALGVSRGKGTLWVIVAALVPFFACMVVTDTVPETAYLMILVCGIILLVMTGNLRHRDAVQGQRLLAMLLVPVMLVTGLLFWAVPQDQYEPMQGTFSQMLQQWAQQFPLWSQMQDDDPVIDTTENPSTVDLSTLGQRSISQQVVMHVTATDDGMLYLRGQAYDSYRDNQWQISQYSTGYDRGWGQGRDLKGGVKIVTAKAYPYYYFPGILTASGGQTYFQNGLLPNPDGEREYTFNWWESSRNGEISPEVRQQCLELPEETRQQAEEILEYLVDPNLYGTKLTYAMAIGEAVRSCAEYSLTPDRMPEGEDFAVWFLTQAERGYCVHFATTATVLLRAAGIPARYVTGYATEVQNGKTASVVEKHAHAWVEFFEKGKGWIILDPTPSEETPEQPTTGPTEPTVEPTTAPTEEPTTKPVDKPTTAPTETMQVTTAPTQPTESKPAATQPVDEDPVGPEKQADWGFVRWLLGLAALAGALWGQYRLRIWLRRRRFCRGTPNEQALRRWRGLLWRGRIVQSRPPRPLRQLAEKAKYSQHTLTEEELAEFDRAMEDMAQKVRTKPWLWQWLLRLLWAIE